MPDDSPFRTHYGSFQGQIKVEGNTSGELGEFELRDFKCSFQQTIDASTGLPAGRMRGVIMEVEIDIEPKCVMILDGLLRNEGVKTKVTYFYPDSSGMTQRFMEIRMERGRCVGFEHMFIQADNAPMVVKLKFSAQELIYTAIDGGVETTYENNYEMTGAR